MGTWKIEGDTSYISGPTTGEGTSFNVSFNPNTGESATGVAQIFTITYTEDGNVTTTSYTLPYCYVPAPSETEYTFNVDFDGLNQGFTYNEGCDYTSYTVTVTSRTKSSSSSTWGWANINSVFNKQLTNGATLKFTDNGSQGSDQTIHSCTVSINGCPDNTAVSDIQLTITQDGSNNHSSQTLNFRAEETPTYYNEIRPYILECTYMKGEDMGGSNYYLHFKSVDGISVNKKITFFAGLDDKFVSFVDGSNCGGTSEQRPTLNHEPYLESGEKDTFNCQQTPNNDCISTASERGLLLRFVSQECKGQDNFRENFYNYDSTNISFKGESSTVILGCKGDNCPMDSMSYNDGSGRSVWLSIPKKTPGQTGIDFVKGPDILKTSQVTFNAPIGNTTVSVFQDGVVFVDSSDTVDAAVGEMFSSITQFADTVYSGKSYSYIEACSLFKGEDLNQCINDIAISDQGELIRTGSTVDVYTYGTNPVTVSGECISNDIDAEVEIWRQSTASMVVGTEPEKEVIEYRTITYTENDFPHNVTSHTFTEDVEYSGKTYPTDITIESTCILRDAHIYISATTIESESVELSGFEIGVQGHELNDKEFTLSGSGVLTANTEIEMNSGSNDFISMTYENYDFVTDASVVYPNTINAIIDGQTLSFTKSVGTYVSEEVDSELKLDYKFFKNDDESMKIVVIVEEKKNLIPDYCEPLHYENSEGNTTLDMRWTGIDTHGNVSLDYKFGQYTTKSFAATSAQSMIGHIISNNTGGLLGTISSNCQNLENYAVILINTASYGTWPGGSMSSTGETRLTFTAQNDSSVTYKVSMYSEIDENNRLLLRGAMVNKVVRVPYTGYNSKIQFYCYPYTFGDSLYTNGVSISYLTNSAEETLTGKNMVNDAVNGDGLSLSLSNINDSTLDYELTYSIAQNNECKIKEFVVQIGNSINEGENYYGRSLGSNHYAAFVHFVQEYKVKNRIYFGAGFLAHKTYDDNYNLTSSSTYEYHAFFETCSSMVLEGDEVVIKYNNVAFPLTDDFEYDVSMDDPTKEIEIIKDNYMWGDTPMRIIKGGTYNKVKFTKKS